MKITYSFKNALTGLKTNKTRSFLTIFGIVIGITAIILVMSLGAGAQNFILSQVQGLGSKTIAIIPGRQPSGPSDFASVFLDSLKERDLASLKNKANVPHAQDVMPIVFGTAKATFESETYQTTLLGGGSADKNNIMAELFDIYPSVGNFFTSEDVSTRASVAVIGEKVRKKLLENIDNPVGQKIKIKNNNFRIIGLLPEKGQVSFFNFDDMILVPYTTAQQYILGRKYFDRIIVSADSENTIGETVSDIKITLRNNHNITDPNKDDFFVQTQTDLAERIGTITTALTLFLVAMASISLFVGGVGIMNIMLVSVTERTKEIGLRKSIGATNQDILTQFLIEAVVLSVIGGIVGIVLGVGLAFIIGEALTRFASISWPFSFPWTGAILGIVVSASIGLIFGIYPARHASQKSPMEALRYE